jgi:hypothetical protein
MQPPVGSWRAGAGDRARLDRFRLRRGLDAEDLPAYASARLAALDQVARLREPPAPEVDGPGGVREGRAAHPDQPAWRPLGPFAVPHGRTAGSGPGSRPRVAGRVAALAIDPRDPGHLLAGAGAGGVWESRDAGRTWRPRTDDQPSPAVGAVAFAPGDPAVAYAGTGEGEPLAALGVGLLRSADGGASWRLLAAPELLGVGFFGLLVDREDAGRLLAATTGGLLASADGGAGWERRLAGRCWAVSAGNDGEVLAGGEHGLHRSEDGGTTWRPVALPSAPGSFDRVAVAHPAGGQVVYVFAAGDGVGHLWRRDRAGSPFEPVKPPADLHSQQAWRSWACAVDPLDPDVVWLGALGLHRGIRGAGGRWSWVDLAARPAGDSLPAAQHALVFEPGDPRALYVANDGGLFRSPDGGRSWRFLGTGLAVAEVDQLAGHPDHHDWLLAEAGELGTLRYEGTEVWFQVTAAEQPAIKGHTDPEPVAVAGQLVAAGGPGLVVSDDGGSTWAEVALPEARGAVTALAVAGTDRLLAGTAEGELLLLLERSGAGPTSAPDDGHGPGAGTPPAEPGGPGAVPATSPGGRWMVGVVARPRAGWVACVVADPQRPGVAWAGWSDARGGRVWRSEDGGASWVDRSGALPAVPVSGLAVDPDRPGTVFAATDAGVWRSEDDGAGWHPLGHGLPTTPALALTLHRRTRLLRVGLLGRGVWELALDEPASAAATALPLLRSRRVAPGVVPAGGWWECPDIKVEPSPGPAPGPVEPVELEDDHGPGATGLPELGGRVRPGQPARVHVQVHQRGALPLRGVRVRVLAVPACLRPPDLPGGTWVLDGDPPPGSPWRAVGSASRIGDLEPGRSGVASFDWDVPADMTRGVCLLAVATGEGTEAEPTAGGPTRPGGGDPGTRAATSPAELVAGDGRWGLKNLTVLGPDGERMVRLELWGAAGRGPFALAAEAWVAELAAGLVLGRRLGGLARDAGLVPARVAEPWRPELVSLVQEDPGLAERLDLAAVFPLPAGHREAGPELWLRGFDLPADRAEPMLLLLREPPPAGRGAVLLLDAEGGVLGGHTLAARG